MKQVDEGNNATLYGLAVQYIIANSVKSEYASDVEMIVNASKNKLSAASLIASYAVNKEQILAMLYSEAVTVQIIDATKKNLAELGGDNTLQKHSNSFTYYRDMGKRLGLSDEEMKETYSLKLGKNLLLNKFQAGLDKFL